MVDYFCRYRKYFPADSFDFVMDEMPMELGYCLIAGAMSMDGFLQFSGISIEGYVSSEVKKLMAEKK